MLLVLCPISRELNHVANHLQKNGVELTSIHSAGEKKLFKAQNFFLGQGGHGKVQYALQAQKLLFHHPEIESVICLGSAGSLSKDVKCFDVVIGEKTVEHDFNESFEPSYAGPPVFLGTPYLVNQWRQLETKNFDIHCGVLASGDEDVTSLERAQEIREKTRALAVAWEGAGGARACLQNKINYLEVRGITDTCDGEVSKDFLANLQKAMENTADLLLQFLFKSEQ